MKAELHNNNVGAALAPRPSAPHSCNLRLHRRTAGDLTVFVTKCIQPRKPVLGPSERALIAAALRHAVEHKRIILAAYVAMPDHWHALFGLLNNWELPRLMHSLMSFVGAKTCPTLTAQGYCWQDGYYETWIRTAKQFAHVAAYIVNNPVRKELVGQPELWDASSLREPQLLTDPWPWEFEGDQTGH